MLAKDFKKEESKVQYPCFVQPKLDGMRCLKTGDKMVSRKNKSIDTMGHIALELSNVKSIKIKLKSKFLKQQLHWVN